MKCSSFVKSGLVILVILGLGLVGCRSKEDKQQNQTLEGTVEEIDVENRMVTMNFFHEKSGRTIPITGNLTEETEIYIDGKLGDMTQIKPDDRVVVEGYQKGAEIYAVKVNIMPAADRTRMINRPTVQPTDQSEE